MTSCHTQSVNFEEKPTSDYLALMLRQVHSVCNEGNELQPSQCVFQKHICQKCIFQKCILLRWRTQCAVAIRKTSYELVAASLIILLLPCIIHPHSTSPFKIWTNTFWNLDKYTLQFGHIHFASCTSQPPSSFSHVSFLHSWHPRRLEPVSKMHKFSTHKWRLFPSQPFTVKIFPVCQQDTCFHNHQRDVCKSEIAGFGQIAIHTYH